MFKDKRIKFIVFLSLVAGLLLGIKLIIPKVKKLEIVETSPKDNQEVSINSNIVFVFNQAVSSQDFIVSTYPVFNYLIENKDQNSISIKPTLLKYSTEYKIELKHERIENFYGVLTFTTTKAPKTPEYDEKQTEKFYEQLEKETYEDYPLFDHIPYYGKDFSIDYLKPLTLEVVLKKETQETREEALEWIRSKGIDPSTHKIEWKYQP